MNVATLRQTLKNYLASRLRIDQWGVGLPSNISDSQNPPSIAIDKPGKFEETGFFQGQGSPTPVTVAAMFPFQIIYRFNSIYKYDQLPRGELEAKLMELRAILRMSAGCELEDVIPGSLKTNSSVTVVQQENTDWLLVCKVTVFCDLLCESGEIYVQSGLFSSTQGQNPIDPGVDISPVIGNAYYKEITTVNGAVTMLKVWDSSAKVSLLMTKGFIYSLGNLTQIVTTNHLANRIYTKTLTYDAVGNLSAIEVS